MEKSAVKRRFYIYGFKILGGNITTVKEIFQLAMQKDQT